MAEPPLITAVISKDASAINELLDTAANGAAAVDLNVVSTRGYTALILAAQEGDSEIVAALLAAPGKDGVAVDLNLADKKGWTALMWAADKDSTGVVAALLAATGNNGVAVDLNLANNEGRTALVLAAFEGNLGVVAALVAGTGKGGVAVELNLADKCGGTALMYAALNGHAEVVAVLLAAAGKDDGGVDLNVADTHGRTALMGAAFKGHVAVAAALLSAAGKDGVAVDLNLADKNGYTALIVAAGSGYVRTVVALGAATGKDGAAVDLNLADKNGFTALISAAKDGHADTVAALVAAPGKDGVAVDLNQMNKGGRTALILAAFKGCTGVVAELLAATGKDGVGADLNLADKDGMTALMCAANHGHVDVVAALIVATGEGGVAVDLNLAGKDGMTALICAAGNGHTRVVAALVVATGKDGVAVDLNLSDKNGITALMFAAQQGHAEVVDVLNGAVGKDGVVVDLNLADNDGETALTVAIKFRYITIVNQLLEYNARVDKDVLATAEACGDPAITRAVQQKVPTKKCAACGTDKYQFKFAKAQLKKSGADRRCVDCVEQGKTVPSATSNIASDALLLQCSVCAVEKPPTQFSKAQRAKKDARKCSGCILQADTVQKEAKAAATAAKLVDEETASVTGSSHQKPKKGKKKKSAAGIKKSELLLPTQSESGSNVKKLAAKVKHVAKFTPEEVVANTQGAAVAEVFRGANQAAALESAEAAAAVEEVESKKQTARAAANPVTPGATAMPSAASSAAVASPSTAVASPSAAVAATTPAQPEASPNRDLLPAAASLPVPVSSTKPPPLLMVAVPLQTHLPTPLSAPEPAPEPASSPQPQPQLPPSPPQPPQPPVATASIPAQLELDPVQLTISAGPALGAGSFATVRGGTYIFPVHGATPVAIKVFHGTACDRPGRGEAAAITELMASSRVSANPHLVGMHGAARLPGHGLCLVMELIVGQSLRIVLDTTAERLPWELRIRWLHEVAQGLDAMHQHKPNPVLHRDLKASNVLLDSADVGAAHAKIADFGVAKAMDSLVVDTYSRGAMEWTAPETLDGIVSFPSDVYSYGILIFEVLTREVPFNNKSGAEKNKLVSLQRDSAQFEYSEDIFEYEGVDRDTQHTRWARKRERTFIKRRPDMELLRQDSPEVLVALMQECWRDEASERPQFDSVVEQLARCVGGGYDSGGDGGGGGKAGSPGGRKQPAPKVSIYTICADELRKADIDLAEDKLSRERASQIFIKGLAGTLEKLVKEIVAQHRLPMPAGRTLGLRTYCSAIQGSNGGDAVFDESTMQASGNHLL